MKERTSSSVEQGWNSRQLNSRQLHPRPDCGSVKLLPMVSEFQAWSPERALDLMSLILGLLILRMG